ncbi:hypothetical protein EDB87DRAFT_1679607 [Lactarius vividus]|nr:hypothetical protein EDB87DRAFT_1679607 [Lactarius vividus]
MYLSSYTLFFISLLGALVSAAPVAEQGSNIDLRNGGGGGGGEVDWKRAIDNSNPLLR